MYLRMHIRKELINRLQAKKTKNSFVWLLYSHYNGVMMSGIAQIKENIKAPRHWPLLGEFTGDRWIPI